MVIVAILATFGLLSVVSVASPDRVGYALAMMLVAFPKAGIKVSAFPFPIFLFGSVFAVFLILVGTHKSAATSGAFVQNAQRHVPPGVVATCAFLCLIASRCVQVSDAGLTVVAQLIAWTSIPPLLYVIVSRLPVSSSMKLLRALKIGYVVAAFYGLSQVVLGVQATAIPGVTYALGDDLTRKHNVIFTGGVQDYSKIYSTYQNGNIFGIVSAVFAVLALLRVAQRLADKLDLLVLLLGAGSIALSGSRTAILAGAVGFLAAVAVTRGSPRLAGVIVILAVAAVAVFTVRPQLLLRYSVSAVVSSGGSGRLSIWSQTLSLLSPTDWLFGSHPWVTTVDGWPGLITQVGILGGALIATAAFYLSRTSVEARVVVPLLVVGASIDGTYSLFPTWFIPALLLGAFAAIERQDRGIEVPAKSPIRSVGGLSMNMTIRSNV